MDAAVFWLKPDVKSNARLRYGQSMRLQTQVCSGNPDHAVRERWTQPLHVICVGNPRTDFQWTSYGDPILTENVVSVFEKEGISGAKFNAVKVENTLGDSIAREWFVVKVSGRGGMASRASGIRILQACPYCGRTVYSGYTNASKIFDSKIWDGSDVFLIWPLPRYIMVTSKVRDIIKKHRFSGVKVAPLSELPKPIAGTLTPGNLEDWAVDRDLQS